MLSILPVSASLDSRLPQAWHLPLDLHLPLLALVLAAITWLGCSLLARRLGRDSLLRALLLRARLSLVIPLLLGGVLLWLLRLLPPSEFPWPSAQDLRQLLVVVALAWSLARCRGALLLSMETTAVVAALEGRERLALLDLLDKLIRVLVAVLLGWQVLRLLGVSAGVLLTAGGFGAAALAFGARTIVENGLSGVGLYLSRPFVVGDVIRLPAQQLQGEVEAIGWFHTRLRDPERQTVYIPNGTFISQAVQNLAQIDRRRLQLEVSLRPRDRDAVPAIVAELQGLLAVEPAVDPELPARVHLVGFGTSGPVLRLLCHAATADQAAALDLQQRLLLGIGAVVERHGAAIALYPRALA
jgi:MscS family membrane protein